MDLCTDYLGFRLAHPIVPGASPLADDLDTVRRLEDNGAPMITLRSLFEEQIVSEQIAIHRTETRWANSSPEAAAYLPDPHRYTLGPHRYLEHLHRVKRATGIPVVASLNGTTPSRWVAYAELIGQAGADALELNLYDLVTSVDQSSADAENRMVEVVERVRERVSIPLAVKLSPFYAGLPHLATRLTKAGAQALVIFNRFYQPDIDIEQLEVDPTLHLSSPAELSLRLRWLAILYGRVHIDLALTGGVHRCSDVIKAVMCGAASVQVVSALLKEGPAKLAELRDGLAAWLEAHEYDSLSQMRGSMSLSNSGNPRAYERANYMEVLHHWKP